MGQDQSGPLLTNMLWKKNKKVVQLGQVVKPVCVSEKLTFKFEKVIKKKKKQ